MPGRTTGLKGWRSLLLASAIALVSTAPAAGYQGYQGGWFFGPPPGYIMEPERRAKPIDRRAIREQKARQLLKEKKAELLHRILTRSDVVGKQGLQDAESIGRPPVEGDTEQKVGPKRTPGDVVVESTARGLFGNSPRRTHARCVPEARDPDGS